MLIAGSPISSVPISAIFSDIAHGHGGTHVGGTELAAAKLYQQYLLDIAMQYEQQETMGVYRRILARRAREDYERLVRREQYLENESVLDLVLEI